jgi:hypothetical protein
MGSPMKMAAGISSNAPTATWPIIIKTAYQQNSHQGISSIAPTSFNADFHCMSFLSLSVHA